MVERQDGARRLERLVRGAMAARGIRDVSRVAAMADLHPNTVYRNLHGSQRPTRRTMSRIAAVLGLDPDDLWRAYDGGPRRRADASASDALDRLAAIVESLEPDSPEAPAVRARGAGTVRRVARGT